MITIENSQMFKNDVMKYEVSEPWKVKRVRKPKINMKKVLKIALYWAKYGNKSNPN